MEPFVWQEAFVKGLRPREVQNNAQYLEVCTNLIPTEKGLVKLVTPTYPSAWPTLTMDWPFPHVRRGSRTKTFLCFRIALYEVTPTTNSQIVTYDAYSQSAQKAIASANGAWHIAAFSKYYFLTNNNSFVFMIPSNTSERVVNAEGAFTVASVCNSKNRLVMAGLYGTYFTSANWLEVVNTWLNSPNGIEERERLVTSIISGSVDMREWIIVSRKAGGAIDYPFAPFMAIFGIPDSNQYTKFREAIMTDIEEGAISILRTERCGACMRVLPLGEDGDFVYYGTSGISIFRSTESGYIEESLPGVEVGVPTRMSADGDDYEHLFVTTTHEIYKLSEGQAPVLLGYKEWVDTLTESAIVVTHDSQERYYWVSDGVNGYCLTRTGLGACPAVIPSSVLRLGSSLVGTSVVSGTPAVTVRTCILDGGQVGIVQTDSIRLATTDTSGGWVGSIHWRKRKSDSFSVTTEKAVDSRGVSRIKQPGREFKVNLTAPDRTLVDLERVEVDVGSFTGSKPAVAGLL